MKLTILFLTIAALHASSKGFSQETISLSGKHMELRRVFNIIQRETSYKFLYKDELLSDSLRVDVHALDMPVTQVLDLVLRNTNLAYRVLDNELVVITTKNDQAGDIEVHGKVTDESGTPLQGVSVKIKGATGGTSTNESGDFSLTAPQGSILIISAVG